MAMTRNDHILDRAWQIAMDAHQGQTDKAGKRYSFHLSVVADKVNTATEKAVAILHDVLEDTNWTEARLREAGVPRYIIDFVQILTRREDEHYRVYIGRVGKDKVATTVKIADLEHNMDLTRITEDLTSYDLKRTKKYHEAWLWLRSFEDGR